MFQFRGPGSPLGVPILSRQLYALRRGTRCIGRSDGVVAGIYKELFWQSLTVLWRQAPGKAASALQSLSIAWFRTCLVNQVTLPIKGLLDV